MIGKYKRLPGGLITETTAVTISVLTGFWAVRVTVYSPAVSYRWVGFVSVLVSPSPKSHQKVKLSPVEVLVKTAVSPNNNGDEARKPAWAGCKTVTVPVISSRPTTLLTVSVTV